MRRGLIALGVLLMICCAGPADAPVVGCPPDVAKIAASLIVPAPPDAEPNQPGFMPNSPPVILIPALRMKCYPLHQDKDLDMLFSLCWAMLPFPEQPRNQTPPPSFEDPQA